MPTWALLALGGFLVFAWLTLAMGYGWLSISGDHNIGIPDIFEAAMTNPPASNDELQQRMLRAQEALASFAAWMYMLGLATMIVTAAGTIAIWRQITLTREALAVARDSNEHAVETNKLELRAYVDASIVPNANDPYLSTGFIVTVTNSGRTPMLDGTLTVTIFEDRLDDEETHTLVGEYAWSVAMGPNGSKTYYFDSDMMEDGAWDQHLSNDTWLIVQTEIEYSDVFGSAHQTDLHFNKTSARDRFQLAAEGNIFT